MKRISHALITRSDAELLRFDECVDHLTAIREKNPPLYKFLSEQCALLGGWRDFLTPGKGMMTPLLVAEYLAKPAYVRARVDSEGRSEIALQFVEGGKGVAYAEYRAGDWYVTTSPSDFSSPQVNIGGLEEVLRCTREVQSKLVELGIVS